MATRLILNADDFGLTAGINRAVAELHSAGAITSATLMAAGPAFEDAVRIALAYPTLGIGCHIVLTDGTPVSPPDSIPTLLGPDRKTFRPDVRSFFAAAILGRLNPAEIEREALAQIRKLQAAGIQPTHIDTHKHTHIVPQIARPVLMAAEVAGVHSIRNPFEPSWSLALAKSSLLRSLQVRLTQALRPRVLALQQLRSGLVRTTDGTIGVSATGNLNAETLTALLAAMPEGTWELVTHPGYNDADLDRVNTRLRAHRETELNALLVAFSPNSSKPSVPHLISYSDLANSHLNLAPRTWNLPL
jgi:predicted glycoside hydrolase/deacetylase ChbG (UPF0249 family)